MVHNGSEVNRTMADTPDIATMLKTRIRPIRPGDDAAVAALVRDSLAAHGLDVPGTAYFDPELDRLSSYYARDPQRRAYFVAVDGQGEVVGGAGLAEFPAVDGCAEVQKLYVAPAARRRGVGSALMRAVEDRARTLGYRTLYLETHSRLEAAVRLYEALGYSRADRAGTTPHDAMDRFFAKGL